MKSVYVIVLAIYIIQSQGSQAQSYHYVPLPDSAKWTYYEHYEYPGNAKTFTISALGDTIIEDSTYTKLYLDDFTYIGGLREANKQIFFRSAFGYNSPVPFVCIPDSMTHRDEIIYDFSVDSSYLQVYDTIEYDCMNDYGIDSSGLVLINGNHRKTYRVFAGYSTYLDPVTEAYEGIGDLACLFSKFHILPLLSASEHTRLICFEDYKLGFQYQVVDTFRVYIGSGDFEWRYIESCTYIHVGLKKTPTVSASRIYPNPSAGANQITISSHQIIDEVSIYSSQGTETIRLSPSTNVIKTDRLPQGVYFVRMKYENGTEEIIKYVK